MVRPKDAVPDIGDGEPVGEFQADVMKSTFHLAGLDPHGPADPRHPLAAGLIGGFMNVTATAEQRLVLLDEPQDGRRADLLPIRNDVHAQDRKSTRLNSSHLGISY